MGRIRFCLVVGTVALCLGLVACSAMSGPHVKRRAFRVALFPYLPDAAHDGFVRLNDRIKHEFESAHPDVELILRPLDPVADDFYGLDQLKAWLTTDSANGGYDVVEVDSLLLAKLVEMGIPAWTASPHESDWHPASRSASALNGKRYGIPHWLCSYFLFARDSQIVGAQTPEELVHALGSGPLPRVVGNMKGSWETPAIYLDAWAQLNGSGGIVQALAEPPNEQTVRTLKTLVDECFAPPPYGGGTNPCISGAFGANPDAAAGLFGAGLAPAMFGYSERLHKILQNATDPEKIQLAAAPLGQRREPLVFTDVLVLNRDCDARCQHVASDFAAYLLDPMTYSWILTSADAKDRTTPIPRYLIPATNTAFDASGLAEDRFYRAIRDAIRPATSYPNSGFPERRKDLQKRILELLTPTSTGPSFLCPFGTRCCASAFGSSCCAGTQESCSAGLCLEGTKCTNATSNRPSARAR